MPRDVAFCKAWLKHLDPRKAWTEAGYSSRNKAWARIAQIKLVRFSNYLKPLQEAKSIQVARGISGRYAA